jgi:hypothetical protein
MRTEEKKMKRARVGSMLVVATTVATVLLALTSQPATASIVRDDTITAVGQGFGAVPRLLTVQNTGNPSSPEAACNSFLTTTTLTQTCSGLDASIVPNGYVNTLAVGDGTVSPAGDTAKNNVVSLSSLGITSASQILINYNPSQTGANPGTDIKDITLKFYNAAGVLIASVDGGCGTAAGCLGVGGVDPLLFADTGVNLGNGGVGFVLALDAAQAAALNAACGGTLAGCNFVTAEVTVFGSNDGPDSFTLFSRAIAAPEPSSLILLGTALAGCGIFLRRRR